MRFSYFTESSADNLYKQFRPRFGLTECELVLDPNCMKLIGLGQFEVKLFYMSVWGETVV